MEQFKFMSSKTKFSELFHKGYFERRMKEYKEEDYRVIFGVKKETFDEMIIVLEKQYKEDHKAGGRKDGVTVVERLEITLKYLRQYVSQRYLAIEYGIAKSCIAPIVKWCMKVLVEDNNFKLPNKAEI